MLQRWSRVYLAERFKEILKLYLKKISLDVERKGAMDAIGMLRIITEGNMDIDEELFACFIDLQKTFDRVNWRCTQSRKYVISNPMKL